MFTCSNPVLSYVYTASLQVRLQVSKDQYSLPAEGKHDIRRSVVAQVSGHILGCLLTTQTRPLAPAPRNEGAGRLQVKCSLFRKAQRIFGSSKKHKDALNLNLNTAKVGKAGIWAVQNKSDLGLRMCSSCPPRNGLGLKWIEQPVSNSPAKPNKNITGQLPDDLGGHFCASLRHVSCRNHLRL